MDQKFARLFEPVQIGPVTAPNRFYQVPHCNGMGYQFPKSLATMRGIKAEGGWGVICTEETEIHHTADLAPSHEGRLWSDADIPAMALMVDAVHANGSLAGVELAYGGHHSRSQYSRIPAFGVRSMGYDSYTPGQTRSMDKEDIRTFRRWHRDAAVRAKQAGFDLIYCYAGHDLSLAMHFMLSRYNDRSDEYGGNLQNRVRLFREMIEDTKEAVGDTCAVVVRLAVDELLGEDGITAQGEGQEIVAMLAELPDLWDVNVSSWTNDSATARFQQQGYQEQYVSFVKSLTSKPVVAVGRYTSPDAMVSLIERGIADFVGAARPSIADPFLPQKIKEDRLEDIRECIGCNICASADEVPVPIRCTQNPTMGEEWRRGWHPEQVIPKKSESAVLVIGAGPAGLECAQALGKRGYHVDVVEARREFGGRVALESALPGLIEWRRVMDWRLTQIEKLPNVTLYPESPMTTEDVLEAGFEHVIVAAGATWRRDGIGRRLWAPIPGADQPYVYTPDDLMAGKLPSGRVVLYDDDHYYMGGVLAELLVQHGCQVTLVTPASQVSTWTTYTLEQKKIQDRLVRLGVELKTQQIVSAINEGEVFLSSEVTGETSQISAQGVVLVTDRLPNDDLYRALRPELAAGTLKSLRVIGDAEAPNIIARAVFSGHLAASEFDEPQTDGAGFKVEYTSI